MQSRSWTASFYVMDVGPTTLNAVCDATGFDLKAGPMGSEEFIEFININ